MIRNQVPVVAGSLIRLPIICSVHLFIHSYTPTPTFPPPEPNADNIRAFLGRPTVALFSGKRSYSLWLGGEALV